MVADETANGGPSTTEESPDRSTPTDSSSRAAADERGIVDDVAELAAPVSWGLSVLAGAGAYVLGYLLTALLFFIGPASFGDIRSLTEQLQVVGFVFNNEHLVDIVTRTSEGNVIGRVNIVLESSGQTSIPTVVYFAIPVIALLGISVGLARRTLAPGDRYPTAVLTGFGLTVGYAALMLGGTVLFVRSDQFGNVAAIDTVMAAAAGVFYPLVVGTAGAVLTLKQLHRDASTVGGTDD